MAAIDTDCLATTTDGPANDTNNAATTIDIAAIDADRAAIAIDAAAIAINRAAIAADTAAIRINNATYGKPPPQTPIDGGFPSSKAPGNDPLNFCPQIAPTNVGQKTAKSQPTLPQIRLASASSAIAQFRSVWRLSRPGREKYNQAPEPTKLTLVDSDRLR